MSPRLAHVVLALAIVAVQRAWLKSCEIQGALTMAPTEWTNRAVNWCKKNQTGRRAEALRLWLGCIMEDEDEYGPVCGQL